MKRMVIVAAFAAAAGLGAPAFAQTYGSVNAYGSSFELTPFEKMEASIAVATDKNGRKFNVIKLPNGKMMALMSVEKIKDFSPYSDDSEMMFGGTKGTTR